MEIVETLYFQIWVNFGGMTAQMKLFIFLFGFMMVHILQDKHKMAGTYIL